MSFRMVNTKHDDTSYENCIYQRDTFNLNRLYESFLKSKKDSDWKPHIQKYEMNILSELSKINKEIENNTLSFLPRSEFILNERGKTRLISGEQIHDRVIKKCLCEDVLLPLIQKYLIYDNGASLKGKGIDFTRRRLETHLRKYFNKNKSNQGYILLIDFSKYFDNLRHEIFINLFTNKEINQPSLDILKLALKTAEVDVSYLDTYEYDLSMNTLFNSLEYQKIDKSLLTKTKFMRKRMNIGDQVSQVAGIAYPIKFDNYIKICKGLKYYGRYMDDSYIIHSDKSYLESLLKELVLIAQELGITINYKKTKIYKLSSQFKFLQIKYGLTETGRIIKKINPKRIVAMRRKLKKLASVIPKQDFENLFNSWFNGHFKIMSRAQRENIKQLFNQLVGENYENNVTK